MADLVQDARHMRGGNAVGYLGVRPRSSSNVVLLAQQRFTFARVVRVGDRLLIRDEWAQPVEKVGRSGGTLVLQDVVKSAYDDAGDLVVTAQTTLVEIARPQPIASREGALTRVPAPHSARVANGGEATVLAPLPEITRTAIVQFCGANGDFSPLHTDELHARAQGYPSVLAHGLMVMAASIRCLTDRIGIDALRTYEAQFLAPVLPGNRLTAYAISEPPGGRTGESVFRVSTRNEDGEEILAGAVRTVGA
jgi:acyl dehydratase